MRSVVMTAIVASLFMVSQVFAADEVPALKLGVIDMQTLVSQSDPAKAAQEQLVAKYGKERADLEKQGEALKKRAESLKNPKVSEDKKVAFLRSRQELDQKMRSLVQRVEQDEAKLRNDIVTLVFKAAAQVAKAKGLTCVTDVSPIIYAEPSMNLTEDVLAEVNKLYKESKAEEPKKDEAKKAEEPAKK